MTRTSPPPHGATPVMREASSGSKKRRRFPGWRWVAVHVHVVHRDEPGGGGTTRDVIALVYQATGTTPRLKVTPAWQMRALGLVNRTVREINEMSYEFDEPFVVDSSRAETEFDLHATPLADAVDETVRWYRAQASASSAADRQHADHVVPEWEQAS